MKYTDETLDTCRAYDLSVGMEVQFRRKVFKLNAIVEEIKSPDALINASVKRFLYWVDINELYPVDYEADEDENNVSCGATCVECGTMNEYQPARAGYVCGLCKGRRAMWC